MNSGSRVQAVRKSYPHRKRKPVIPIDLSYLKQDDQYVTEIPNSYVYYTQYILTYIQIKQKEEPNFFNTKNCKKNKNI